MTTSPISNDHSPAASTGSTPREAKRLEALQQYNVMDTEPENAFDELTDLAASVCDVPISMISLVDDKRQWFKSKIGVDRLETPREHSFCAHALARPDLFIVPDAMADSRFVDNPLVTGDPGIRFYAGAPLLTKEGLALGTICVIDRKQRQLSHLQTKSLSILSRQVMAQFELRRRTNALVESETLLFKIFRNCPVAVALKTWREEVFLHVNEAFTDLLGLSQEEILGRKLSQLYRIEKTTGKPGRENVVSMRTKNGVVRQVLVDSTLVIDAVEPQVITTYVDITELERAEEALHLSEDRMHRLRLLMAATSIDATRSRVPIVSQAA